MAKRWDIVATKSTPLAAVAVALIGSPSFIVERTCFTFLAAQGVSVGTSLLQEEMIDTCRQLLETYGDVIHLTANLTPLLSSLVPGSIGPGGTIQFTVDGTAQSPINVGGSNSVNSIDMTGLTVGNVSARR